MEAFEIYTLGSGFYLEKILNAIRIIVAGDGGFISILKFASIAAITALAVRAGINNDLKSTVKWFAGVTILVGVFLTGKATVIIHDRLPDSYGIMQAQRVVKDVPIGLAFLGSATSGVGNFLAEKFDMAFAGVFVNSTYQETGMLFGSKIIEDVSKLRIQDPNLKAFVGKFYKRCVVPDLRMGYSRANGYTVKDLAETDDILEFLKDHSSKARMINYDTTSGTTSGATSGGSYISCNQAANNIAGNLNKEVIGRQPKLAVSFLSYFFPDYNADSNLLFETVLQNSYHIFLKNSSKDAKDLLLQNVMINALSDKAGSYSKAFGKVTAEETTGAAYYSIAQMAQKFVPIYRAVLECILYGIFPLILVLMVTPIGLEVLKNYGFGFIYLQMWQPMYAILFCIAGTWGKSYASGIDSLTLANHARIAHINTEISSIAGYMLASIPILSIFITKGMVSGMGNLASSVFYVQQSAAVQNAEQAIRGNYQVGTTQIDTHSFNTTSGNKFDDNHSWQSGMKSFSMQSGAMEKQFTDGRVGIDSSHAVSNLAGLAKVDWSHMVGSRFDQSILEQQSKADRLSVSSIESATSGYSKLLGFDKNFSQSSQEYQNWNNSLTTDQREAFDETRNYVNKLGENNNLSQQDALRLAVATSMGSKGGVLGLLGLSGFDISAGASSGFAKENVYNKALDTSKSSGFSSALSKVHSFAISESHQEGSTLSDNIIQSSKNDFYQSEVSSYQASKAMDRVRNLQESKSRYEQNSGTISQDLTNKFAEAGIAEAGSAASFEEMIRNNPVKARQMQMQFLDRYIPAENKEIADSYQAEKQNFSTDDLRDIHVGKSKSMEHSFEDKNQANTIPPMNSIKETIIEKQDNLSKSLEQKKSNANQKADNIEKNLLEKNSKSLLGTIKNKIITKKDDK